VGTRAASSYWELTIASSDATSEGLTNFLWELGALGVVEEDIPSETPRLRAFFPATAEAAQLCAQVNRYVEGLEALGLGTHAEAAIAPLIDGGWATAWREHFRPLPVGRRLVIAPPWDVPVSNHRLVITIEPGRAFGTGHHATTAGCLEALERQLESAMPDRVLDLGTGSGILAIAAARLAAPAILAVDDDPDAVACAIANAARNGVADRIRAMLGDAGAIALEPAPLVLANLLSAAHVRLAARYRDMVARQGTLVLGGILESEADFVTSTIVTAGFAPDDARTIDGWTTLVFSRNGARSAPLHDRG
jgi:ribosomal protein L11 methyltransferase